MSPCRKLLMLRHIVRIRSLHARSVEPIIMKSTGTTERTEHDISNAGSSLTVVATKNACEFCSWHRYYLCYSCGSAIYREHIYAAYSCIGITKQRGRSLLRCFTCTDICPYILCPYKCTDTVGANHIRESPSNKAIDARAGNML